MPGETDLTAPLAAVFGCAGPVLTDRERDFFAEVRPLGFILFARNVDTPAQVRRLVDDLRRAVGRSDAPVMIDQEGGRVQRLGPPHWRRRAPTAQLAALLPGAPDRAERAVWLHGRLLAADLADLGIDVDCWPCLDLRQPGGHDVIGDRAFGSDPDSVARLGRAACEGLLAGGVAPVIKHLPGHGRAAVDSHHELPRVSAPAKELAASDFVPFRALADAPWGMTAHVLYDAIDSQAPATTSPRIISEVIRGDIGFDGLLLSDDLSMQALSGDLAARCSAALEAGCDVALHCNGRDDEMRAVAQAARPLGADGRRRLSRAKAMAAAPQPFDRAAAEAELSDLLAEAPALDNPAPLH